MSIGLLLIGAWAFNHIDPWIGIIIFLIGLVLIIKVVIKLANLNDDEIEDLNF